MTIFHIISAFFVLISSGIFILSGKNKYLLKPSLLFYSLIFSVYLFLCPFILKMLLEMRKIEKTPKYLQTFLLIITITSIIPSIMLLALNFVKSNKNFNNFYNGYFLFLIAIYVPLLISLFFKYRNYFYIFAFVPLHFIFPLTILSASLLNFNILNNRIKIIVTFSALALFFIFGTYQVVANMIKFSFFDFNFILMTLVLMAIACFGLLNILIKIKRRKSYD